MPRNSYPHPYQERGAHRPEGAPAIAQARQEGNEQPKPAQGRPGPAGCQDRAGKPAEGAAHRLAPGRTTGRRRDRAGAKAQHRARAGKTARSSQRRHRASSEEHRPGGGARERRRAEPTTGRSTSPQPDSRTDPDHHKCVEDHTHSLWSTACHAHYYVPMDLTTQPVICQFDDEDGCPTPAVMHVTTTQGEDTIIGPAPMCQYHTEVCLNLSQVIRNVTTTLEALK